LLMDRCSDKLNKIVRKKIRDLKETPSGLPAFFIYLAFFIFSAYGFSSSIPWSSEAGTVLYYNAPSSWALSFENIKGLYKVVKELDLEKSKERLIEEVSLKNNIDSRIINSFLESRIVIISDEAYTFNFQAFLGDFLDIPIFLNRFFSASDRNIICVEQFDGLETLMNVLSHFKVQAKTFGEFTAFSGNADYLEQQFPLMLGRNEFSKDVIFYSESAQETVEVTNAYSFLNFERKEMFDSRNSQYAKDADSQFLLDNVTIPFVFQNPDYFEISSAYDLKTSFYDRFEIRSSIEEWLSVFELLKKGVLFTFFFSNASEWMIGFKCSDELLADAQWKRYLSSWGLTTKKTIKPFADEYYLSLYDDYFVISNYTIQKTDVNNQIVADIMTKFERNLLLKAEVIDQDYNPDTSKLKIYHFSYIDDRIKKDLFRVF